VARGDRFRGGFRSEMSSDLAISNLRSKADSALVYRAPSKKSASRVFWVNADRNSISGVGI
jgi:hypothetical protein